MKPNWNLTSYIKSLMKPFRKVPVKEINKCPSLNCYCVRNCSRCETIIYLCHDVVKVKEFNYYCSYCKNMFD